MHDIVLFLHSWMRWVVVLLGVAVVARGWTGWWGKRSWTPLDERLARGFPIVLDIQLLLGILLLVTSPYISPVFQQGMKALANPQTRFWVTEHVVPMLGAVVLAHLGQVFIRRTPVPEAKYRWAGIVFGLAVIVVLFSIPWPFSRVARPFFRLF